MPVPWPVQNRSLPDARRVRAIMPEPVMILDSKTPLRYTHKMYEPPDQQKLLDPLPMTISEGDSLERHLSMMKSSLHEPTPMLQQRSSPVINEDIRLGPTRTPYGKEKEHQYRQRQANSFDTKSSERIASINDTRRLRSVSQMETKPSVDLKEDMQDN